VIVSRGSKSSLTLLSLFVLMPEVAFLKSYPFNLVPTTLVPMIIADPTAFAYRSSRGIALPGNGPVQASSPPVVT
jgi:hypothetical protein